MRKRSWLILAGLIFLGPLMAQSPSEDKLKGLIEQLGDSDYARRQEAFLQLQKGGIQALRALRQVGDHPDPHVRQTVQELIPVLQADLLFQPRTVSLSVQNKTLAEIFAEINRQTGMRIDVLGQSRQLYSFDFTNLTFWQAIDRICSTAGIILPANQGADRLVIQPEDGFCPFVHHQDIFRFSVTTLQQTSQIDLSRIQLSKAPPVRIHQIGFNFLIHVEPRFQILGIGDIKLTSATDSENNSMLPPDQPGDNDPLNLRIGRRFSNNRLGSRSTSYQASTVLLRPSLHASTIRTVQGAVPVHLLTEQKPVTLVENIKKGKGHSETIDGIRFEILEVNEQPNKLLQLRLAIQEDNRDPDQTQINTIYQRLHLLDTRNNPYMVYGTQWSGTDPNHIELTVTFGPPANGPREDAGRLEFISWKTMTRLAHFEFQDLPLP